MDERSHASRGAAADFEQDLFPDRLIRPQSRDVRRWESCRQARHIQLGVTVTRRHLGLKATFRKPVRSGSCSISDAMTASSDQGVIQESVLRGWFEGALTRAD